MNDWLLKLFGIRSTDAGRIVDTSVDFHGVVNPLWVFIIAVALGVLVFVMYARTAEKLGVFRRLVLSLLRFTFLLLILAMLTGPVLQVTFEQAVRRTLLLVMDGSASMSDIKDQRVTDEDRKRAAIARGLIDPAKGLGQSLPAEAPALATTTRLEVAREALKNPRLDLLGRLGKDFDLAAFTFGGRETELTEVAAAAHRADPEAARAGKAPPPPTAWLDKLEAKAPLSAVGDSVRKVIADKRGQLLAGVVLVTDGASNTGLDPNDAAAFAASNRVPLYIYGVGIADPRDLVVTAVQAPAVVFVKDEVSVNVNLAWTGMAGQTARLVVELADARVEQDVTFDAPRGEKAVAVTLAPKVKGEHRVRATLVPRDDEVSTHNNSAADDVNVIDEKIKVLYVEQYPRWEFKYVFEALRRDRRIDAKYLLLEGDPSITRTPGSPYLAELPRREELLKLDVIILGDVDPKALRAEQMEAIHEFVGKLGGALIALAGKRYMPDAYRKTPLEKMLPVELESTNLTVSSAAARPVKMQLTPSGKKAEMLRLAEGEQASEQLWARLPPVYWVHKVARAKPSANVLVVDPDPAKASRYGSMPLVAMIEYDVGQVLYVGTDNLWRIRKNAGDKHHAALWGQVVQRMAQAKLLGSSKRTRINPVRKTYQTGERVQVNARLYTESFTAMTDPAVRLTVRHKDAADAATAPAAVEVAPLTAVPAQPGHYRVEFTAPQPGRYVLGVDHDPANTAEIVVEEPKFELSDTAMKAELLARMAQVSGGAFFREEDLAKMPERITGRDERVRTRHEVELWSSAFYFLLMLGVVTAEWVLRKMSQLK